MPRTLQALLMHFPALPSLVVHVPTKPVESQLSVAVLHRPHGALQLVLLHVTCTQKVHRGLEPRHGSVVK